MPARLAMGLTLRSCQVNDADCGERTCAEIYRERFLVLQRFSVWCMVEGRVGDRNAGRTLVNWTDLETRLAIGIPRHHVGVRNAS